MGHSRFCSAGQTVPGSLAAMILGQGLALVAVGADLRLQDSLASCFSVASLPFQETLMLPAGDWIYDLELSFSARF